MSKRIKIIAVLLLPLSVLICVSAVTQIFNRSAHTARPVPSAGNNDKDTTGIGEPTGDDPWKELDKLVKAYYIKDGVFYQGTIKLFDDNGDAEKLLEEKKFQYTYFNNEYSYSLGPLEVINKKDYAVIVNHEDKMISVSPKITASVRKKDLLSITDLKNIIEQQNANVTVTRLGDEKILTIDSIQDADIQGYRIYYSPETYMISKIIVGMVRLYSLDDESAGEEKKDAPVVTETNTEEEADGEIEGYYYYLEINYSVIKPLSLQEGEFNPEKKFIRIEGKKLELAPEFAGYQLFNTDEK